MLTFKSRFVLLSLFTVLLIFSPVKNIYAANPWVQSYPAPIRTQYIGPNGTATANGSQSDPLSFNQAVLSSQPGDLYWVMSGTYPVNFLNLTKDATASAPIVYRALPGTLPKVVGSFDINADNTWFWGLDLSNPANQDTTISSGIDVFASGVHLVNNIIHDMCDSNGVGGWEPGTGQIYYGNILYNNGCNPTFDPAKGRIIHPHNTYTQNEISTHGIKYYVNNMFLEPGCPSNCFSLNAYTEGGSLSGFDFENNIFANTSSLVPNIRALLGGTNYTKAEEKNKFSNNYYYQVNMQLGYHTISQFEFKNNYLGRSLFVADYLWSAGDIKFTKTSPNVITGNYFINPLNGTHLDLRTAAFRSSTSFPDLGVPKLDTSDTMDGNFYTTPFKANLHANVVSSTGINFSTWKVQTASAGKAFDINSTEIPVPTTAKVVVIPNEYEQGRGNIAIYNWGNQTNVPVDISTIVSVGSTYEIKDPKNMSGSAVMSDTYNGGNVNIPTTEKEFLSLIVLSNTSSPSPTPSKPGDANGDGIVDDSDYIIWLTNFGKNLPGSSVGDFNNNGKINGQDYVIWLINFGK